MATSGVLDGDAVDAVLVTAGHAAARAPRLWPAGLSDREVQVLRLICRGATKKQAAATLSISPRTVDHHVRHIYDKVGVQSRAGVTVFAMANGLLNSPS